MLFTSNISEFRESRIVNSSRLCELSVTYLTRLLCSCQLVYRVPVFGSVF
jgi:hypothetical protein